MANRCHNEPDVLPAAVRVDMGQRKSPSASLRNPCKETRKEDKCASNSKVLQSAD